MPAAVVVGARRPVARVVGAARAVGAGFLLDDEKEEREGLEEDEQEDEVAMARAPAACLALLRTAIAARMSRTRVGG